MTGVPRVPTKMEYALKQIVRFEECEWPISDWLQHFSKRCVTAKVTDDKEKIGICGLYIGSAGETVLDTLPAGTTWAEVEETLIREMGRGSAAEEAYETLRTLKRNNKSLLEVGKRCERLARIAYPDQPELQERHGREAFLRALSPNLAARLQQFGYTKLPELIKGARRIEEYPLETPAPPAALADLTARLKALEQQTHNQAPAPVPTPAVNYALPQPGATGPAAPAGLPQPPTTSQRPPFRRTFKEPPPSSRRRYQERQHDGRRPYPNDRRSGSMGYPRSPGRCFLCDEVGHFVAECPWKTTVANHRDQTGTPRNPTPTPPPHRESPRRPDAPSNPEAALNFIRELPRSSGLPSNF